MEVTTPQEVLCFFKRKPRRRVPEKRGWLPPWRRPILGPKKEPHGRRVVTSMEEGRGKGQGPKLEAQ